MRVCVCVCVCVWLEALLPSTSVSPQAVGFVFILPREARWTCILIHFTIQASEAAPICIPRHTSVPLRLTGSLFFFFFFFLLFYTSKASDGWIPRCSGVNLSCMKLSVLKEAVGRAEEAVCVASRCCWQPASVTLLEISRVCQQTNNERFYKCVFRAACRRCEFHET